MTVKDLERRFDYGCWANRKLFTVVANLTPEQFTQHVAGSYGSVRNTLVHMLSAESGWLERCGGPPRGPKLKADDFPTLASVVDRWSTVETQVRGFLANLTDADVSRSVEFSLGQSGTRTMPLGELLEHAVNHGVHHRGQVSLLLRELGQAPGDVDLLFYDIEKPRVSAW